jgi:NADPH:quinone reductase
MHAHVIAGFTGPDDVQWREVDEPAADGGVVIDVIAAGVSFADLLQTRGAYQMRVPLPYTPGMDAAGVVRPGSGLPGPGSGLPGPGSVLPGPGSGLPGPGSGLLAGQRVAVLQSYGCWQQVISVPAERVLPLPDGMSFEAGAATPLNYLTGLFALARRGRAQAGETLLIHGAAGGVGTAAIQLGRALGLRTVAVVSDEAKQEFVSRCGADHAVLSDGWLTAVRDLVGERAVDIVLDPVGSMAAGPVGSTAPGPAGSTAPGPAGSTAPGPAGSTAPGPAGSTAPGPAGRDRMTDSLRALAPEGRVLVLGFTGGEIPTVKVNRLLLGNTGVLGVASREFFEQRPALVGELWAQLIELRRTGMLGDPPVELYSFGDARGALRAIADRRAKGKVVLSRQVGAGLA